MDFSLRKRRKRLREAGLKRVSFSLDSLDRENFKKITGRDGLAEVLESIDLAQQLGFTPVKINAVVIRGVNDHELEALAGFAQRNDLAVRFIEFMPLGFRSRAGKRNWSSRPKKFCIGCKPFFPSSPLCPKTNPRRRNAGIFRKAGARSESLPRSANLFAASAIAFA